MREGLNMSTKCKEYEVFAKTIETSSSFLLKALSEDDSPTTAEGKRVLRSRVHAEDSHFSASGSILNSHDSLSINRSQFFLEAIYCLTSD